MTGPNNTWIAREKVGSLLGADKPVPEELVEDLIREFDALHKFYQVNRPKAGSLPSPLDQRAPSTEDTTAQIKDAVFRAIVSHESALVTTALETWKCDPSEIVLMSGPDPVRPNVWRCWVERRGA